MAKPKATTDPTADFEAAFNFKALAASSKLEEARALVIGQNTRLVLGEGSTRAFGRKVAYNNYALYARISLASNGADIVAGWLKQGAVKVRKSAKLSMRVARAAWPSEVDDEGRRASDEAKVLSAAHRYFIPASAKNIPTLEDFLAWVDRCAHAGGRGGRRGRHLLRRRWRPKDLVAHRCTFAARRTDVRQSALLADRKRAQRGPTPYSPRHGG